VLATAVAGPHPRQGQRGDGKGRGVEPERRGPADTEDQRRCERRAHEGGDLPADPAQCLSRLDVLLGHGLGDQARVRRLEERLGRPVEEPDHDHVPDPDGVESDQERERPVQDASCAVGDDHHRLARQPVGNHATDEQEQHEWDDVRREDKADVAGVARQPGHEQTDRHDDEPVADHTCRLAQPEQPEVARAEGDDHLFTLVILVAGHL
jgi:hypothetical protein